MIAFCLLDLIIFKLAGRKIQRGNKTYRRSFFVSLLEYFLITTEYKKYVSLTINFA